MKPNQISLCILVICYSVILMVNGNVTKTSPSSENRIFKLKKLDTKFIDDFENVAILRDFLFDKYRDLNNIKNDENNELGLKDVKLNYEDYIKKFEDLIDNLEKSTSNLNNNSFIYKDHSYQLIDYCTLLIHNLSELVKAHNQNNSKFNEKTNEPIPELY